MIYAPVWKDTYYTTNAETLSYSIYYGSNVIFSGRAYAMPGSNLRIKINDICAEYLFQNIDFEVQTTYNTGAIGTFYLRDSNGATLETYTFLNCYDYDFNWTGQSATLSNPISDVYGYGMTVPTTTVSAGGSVTTVLSTPAKTDGCIKYGLYYVNRKGGWDAYAPVSAKKQDNITQFTTDRSFDNTTLEFEANRYLAEIKTAYVMQTAYLNDEQSENLAKNLISTNKLYIHNLTTGVILPALITDSSVTYQTYQNSGKKMSQYTINVAESQSRLIR